MIELDEQGGVRSPQAARHRATQQLLVVLGVLDAAEPPFEDWETELVC